MKDRNFYKFYAIIVCINSYLNKKIEIYGKVFGLYKKNV